MPVTGPQQPQEHGQTSRLKYKLHKRPCNVQDVINQVAIVNIVAEGIQQAMKSPLIRIIDVHCQETTNLAEENTAMQKKLDDMHDLVCQMQQKIAQQQQQPPPYTQQYYQQSNYYQTTIYSSISPSLIALT
eukprot:11705886-Ditylum_brightwellii.AAC.1